MCVGGGGGGYDSEMNLNDESIPQRVLHDWCPLLPQSAMFLSQH